MSSLLIGQKLGKYQVSELLGQGGMATVYKGFQAEIERYVAIKVLPPHPGLDAQFVERFKLEARTIARLQHPHILPLYDYGEENGVLYLAMAFMDGGSLADIIDSGPMNVNTIEKILREIASALDYAHRQGIIHRDIKPGNILLDGEGHALLADFGIVKITGGANLTGTGVVGTPAYMAPEQIEGSGIDPRADVYALGAVVYEMLTGQQPYKGDTPMQVLIQHMQAPVPRVCDARNDLPDGLNYVLQRALSKDPNARYQTAVEFAEDFTRAVHMNEESWAGVKAQMPLASGAYDTAKTPPSTVIYGDLPAPTPTIIMQQTPATSPLVLLGGFALIALVLVVAVVLILNNQNQNNSQNPTPDTQVAGNPTSQAVIRTPAPSVPTFGRLSFTQSTNPGDTIQLQVNELSPAGEGKTYAAWLLNTSNDTYKMMGTLTLDAFGTGAITFVDPKNFVLPGWFDAVVITTESEIGEEPVGEIRYSGAVPFELTSALRNILVDSNIQPATTGAPTPSPEATPEDSSYDNFIPRDTSLLSGVLSEAQTGVQHTGLAAQAENIGGLRTHSEHTINIFLGTSDDYNGNGRGENPGRKIGVLFYLDEIEKLLNAATSAPNASMRVQTEGELIRVCTQNVRGWVEEVVSLEREMLLAEDITTVETQKARSTEVAGWIIDGHDLNENGVVEAFEGECGLMQIPTFGVSVANMDIVQGPLAQN